MITILHCINNVTWCKIMLNYATKSVGIHRIMSWWIHINFIEFICWFFCKYREKKTVKSFLKNMTCKRLVSMLNINTNNKLIIFSIQVDVRSDSNAQRVKFTSNHKRKHSSNHGSPSSKRMLQERTTYAFWRSSFRSHNSRSWKTSLMMVIASSPP